jgi:hypothetical protein
MLSIKLVELNKLSVVDQSLCAPYTKLLCTFVAVAYLKNGISTCVLVLLVF